MTPRELKVDVNEKISKGYVCLEEHREIINVNTVQPGDRQAID